MRIETNAWRFYNCKSKEKELQLRTAKRSLKM